jgi:GT2 family glycosyltransferase
VASSSDVTIVVVPRERFSMSEPALATLYEHTPPGFSLVYVDGNSPRRVSRSLTRLGREKGFEVLRSERFLSPNQARNLGMTKVRTPYVVFIDNDCFVSDGWLDALLRCTEETGAWVVAPLYFQGDPEKEVIHVAGGAFAISEENGKRLYADRHTYQGVPLGDVPEPLERSVCDFVEFHCVLVRRDALERLGPLDEGLLSTREHVDLSLSVREAGGSVWFEPASRVTYLTPPPLAASDVRFYLRRWSETWNAASLRHFYSKWGFDNTIDERLAGMARRRLVVLTFIRQPLSRLLGNRAQWLFDGAILRLERPLNRALFRAPRSG